MKYIEYLKSTRFAKATLAVFIISIILAVYVISQTARFFGAIYVIGCVLAFGLIYGILFICQQKKPKLILSIGVCLLVVLLIGTYTVTKVNGVVKHVSQAVEYESVQIAALKNSGISCEDAFDNYTLGYVNNDQGAYERSSEILVENNKEVLKSKPYASTEVLYEDLNAGEANLIVLTSNTRSDLSVIDEEYEDKITILFEKKYELKTAELNAVDITKEPFTLYLCGADLSSGENINSTGRGDVNILLTVNPNTKKVNMQVIPRDTFVYIPCRGGSSKLSYSGWWGGVQSSIESIEEKFGIEINYYAKINFNGLVDLVDALGGVTVYSNYTYSYQGYDFVVGENFVDGQKALRFARARKMLPENELSRGQHQMELIKGIFRKFAENPSYDSAMAVLDSLSNNFVTNLPEEDYYDAFLLVVDLLPQLQTMENHSIEGEYQWHDDEVRDGYYQYYYYPTESEIQRVKNDIQRIIDGK